MEPLKLLPKPPPPSARVKFTAQQVVHTASDNTVMTTVTVECDLAAMSESLSAAVEAVEHLRFK